jgi:hypothetical protein
MSSRRPCHPCSNIKDLPFTFKCHRDEAKREIYPVHAVKYYPSTDARIQHILVTAGGDGSFVFWDKMNKQRVIDYTKDKTFVCVGTPTPALQ